MSLQVVNLPPFIPTSTAATAGLVTNGVGSLDDAESITIYMASTANAASTGTGNLRLQISQHDPSVDAPAGVTQSTGWFTLSSALFSTGATGSEIVLTSSGNAFTISPVAFRGIRFIGVTSGVSGQAIAHITKSIFV